MTSNISGLTWMAIFSVALIVIGFISIGVIANIMPESSIKNYTYSTNNNATVVVCNTSLNNSQFHYLTLPTAIRNLAPTETLQINFTSTDTSDRVVTPYLNGVSLGAVTVIASADGTTPNSTSTTVTGINFRNGANNITFVTAANVGNDVNATVSTSTYGATVYNIAGRAGGFYDTVVGGFSTIAMVLIAVIALFCIFALLRVTGMMGDGSRGK